MSTLIIGGTGTLGKEITALLPDVIAPTRQELDITQPETIARTLDRHAPHVVVHMAAYTDVANAEQNREDCWRINVMGTRNLVAALLERRIPLIYISTDYVFYGDRGRYTEDDPVGMVRNYYALSKLVAEELVHVLSLYVIIRTSFRPRTWPFSTAATDLYTSQDYVDVIAPDIAMVITSHAQIPYHVLHIATERKSTYELAVRRKPDVIPISRTELRVELPEDISLDTSRWKRLKETLVAKGEYEYDYQCQEELICGK